MFVIGEIVVEDTVARTQFHCDLARCKGACCTVEGGRGAPLLDHETVELEAVLPYVRKYLSAQHLDVIGKQGIVEGPPGDRVTTCVDEKACVFVMVENGIAKCAIEHAWQRGEVGWRKPLSCHLFPIRIRRFGGDILYYEEFSGCAPALVKGEKEGVNLFSFLREALVRAYGAGWYEQFRNVCRSLAGTDEDKR